MDHEVWITLRFKGSADATANVDEVAKALLEHLEGHLQVGGQSHGFEYCQPGDVLEVLEEREIYGSN